MKRITKNQAKSWFDLLDSMDEHYYATVDDLEAELQKKYGKGLMFVWVDGMIVGIGSEDRKMKLIHRS